MGSGTGGVCWNGFLRERPFDRLRARLQPRALAVAPPPAKAGGGWEGVLTVRVDPKSTPPQPSPAFAGEGARARSEERRVGKEGVSPGRNRWSPDHEKKKTKPRK